jgi:flagellar basal-body rod protein FlgB
MPRDFFPDNLAVIHKNLDMRMARHRVLSSNLANAETPGYIAKDVDFEAALRDAVQPPTPNALQQTHPHHLSNRVPSVTEVQGRLIAAASDDVGGDLNTVSLDQEMGKLTVNTFHYNTSIELLSRSLDKLKRTISDGGR